MKDIRIVFDTLYSDELSELYFDSSQEEGFLRNTLIKDVEQAKSEIEEIIKLQKNPTSSLFCFTKVFLKNELVGISFVKQFTPEFRNSSFVSATNRVDFKLIEDSCVASRDKTWYRLGYFYIKPSLRGKGIGSEVLRVFVRKFRYVIYQCDKNNFSSFKVANSCLKNYGLNIKEGYYTFFSI